MQGFVIDFRVRPPLPSFASNAIFRGYGDRHKLDQRTLHMIVRHREEAVSAAETSMPLFIKEMDEAGITHGVIMGRNAGQEYGISDNEEIARFCSESKGRFVGFAGVDGTKPAEGLDIVRRARGLGLVGLAFDNGYGPLHQDDPALWPIYDVAAANDLPIALTASPTIGPDISYSHPDRLRTLAKRYPKLPIIATHGAWPWTVFCCALAYECPNVYLLPDCYLNMRAPGTDEYVTSANNTLTDRLLYGSAYPVRPLGQSIRGFRSLPLRPEVMEAALWKNAQRLLNWPN